MRKPKDYDAELKALDEKAKQLRQRKTMQHGELVAATGADALDPDLLAGGMLDLVALDDKQRKEELRARGAAFFRPKKRNASRATGRNAKSAAKSVGGAASSASEAGAA